MTTPHQLRQWLADHKHLAPRVDDGYIDDDSLSPDELRYRIATEQLASLEKAAKIRPRILFEGQAVVDEPVYETISADPLAYGIASAFGREIRPTVEVFRDYASTKLRWMKPGPDGKLIPAGKKA